MKQTLVALVDDKPGILNRISSMFRRRNFNIESLVVGSSETPGISRMTIIANEPDSTKRGNIYFNLLNLVNVISVEDITSLPCINREYVLIKIHAGSGKWSSIGEVTKNNGARIVDMGKGSVIIEAAGEEKPGCENENQAYTLLPRNNNWNIVKWYFKENFENI